MKQISQILEYIRTIAIQADISIDGEIGITSYRCSALWLNKITADMILEEIRLAFQTGRKVLIIMYDNIIYENVAKRFLTTPKQGLVIQHRGNRTFVGIDYQKLL